MRGIKPTTYGRQALKTKMDHFNDFSRYYSSCTSKSRKNMYTNSQFHYLICRENLVIFLKIVICITLHILTQRLLFFVGRIDLDKFLMDLEKYFGYHEWRLLKRYDLSYWHLVNLLGNISDMPKPLKVNPNKNKLHISMKWKEIWWRNICHILRIDCLIRM